MHDLLFYIAIGAWGVTLLCVTWSVLTVASQITYVTLADGRQEARSLPLLFRLVLPLTHNFDKMLRRPSFQGAIHEASWQLTAAGFEGLLSAREFLAIKFLLPLCAAIAFSPFLLMMGSDGVLPWMMITLLFWVWPLRWLRGAREARAKSILRALPFVLDLLTLSVEAGLDFMGAVQRNCERRKMDPLNEELLRMQREIQIGTTRRVALQNLSERVRIPQMRTLCTALIQADELGVSIGTILRIQSEQLRQERFERAEKQANEAPTKILFPLLLFIFPATLVVLVGPVLTAAMKDFLA
jgi:tight adherence protein C